MRTPTCPDTVSGMGEGVRSAPHPTTPGRIPLSEYTYEELRAMARRILCPPKIHEPRVPRAISRSTEIIEAVDIYTFPPYSNDLTLGSQWSVD